MFDVDYTPLGFVDMGFHPHSWTFPRFEDMEGHAPADVQGMVDVAALVIVSW